MRHRYSLNSSVTMLGSAFLVILIILTVFTAIQLTAISSATDVLSDHRVQTRNVLGEIRTQLSHLRLIESERALAPSPIERQLAEQMAAGPRLQIAKLRKDYAALSADSDSKDLRTLSQAIDAFLSADEAWVQADLNGQDDAPVRLDGSIHGKYLNARSVVGQLIRTNGAAVELDAEGINERVQWLIAAILACLVAGVLTAIGIMRVAKRAIITPMTQITTALSRLAAGDGDIRLPERNRMHEIDAMVRAFAVFQANALALEEAHEATRVAQESAQSLARHDALTGLPNRRVFTGELDRVMALVKEGKASCYLLLIDLDRFKPVNDIHGHAIGDAVLCEVAHRLSWLTRGEDIVARLGGDEFAVIAQLPIAATEEHALTLSGKLLAGLSAPIVINELSISIGASIGVARCEADRDDAAALLREADLAMYRAKRDGRGTVRVYEESMDEELRAQANLEADLRAAVRDQVIEPHFQPLVDMKTGEVFGFELLSRWFNRGHWIAPDDFIPLAEHLGIISDLTWSTLRAACRAAKNWPDHIRLSINISPMQLKDAMLPVRLLSILTQEGFAPSRLEIEITESALVEDIGAAKAILHSMQNLGIQVALDDFGTGYSSLFHLRELRFDKVKIDKSFVQAMRVGNESEKIVDAILSLSRSLCLPAVAEGIEDAGVRDQLIEKGCELGQGYYFGKAMDAVSASLLVNQNRASTGAAGQVMEGPKRRSKRVRPLTARHNVDLRRSEGR